MGERIDTAAVLGAGVMGSAIAAHLAGAGIRTLLLDIVPPKLDPTKKDPKKDKAARSAIAIDAIGKTLKAKPAAFYDPEAARLVTPGNFEDDLDKLAKVDLVIEAVVERMDIKKDLWGKVAKAAGAHTLLATNTSGLSLTDIAAVLPDAAQQRFLGMHFFNPVRYMRLLEIIPGPRTEPAVMARAARIGELLGKGIVYGKDTANFVANRVGVYGMMMTMRLMEEGGYSIEEIDKITGPAMGHPSSATFRTADLVGIDTLSHVAQNCYDNLPKDEERDIFKMPAFVKKMIEKGAVGQKAGAGFFKKQGDEILVLDIKTGEYRPQGKVRFESLGVAKNEEDVGARLKGLVNADDKAGQLAWKLTASVLCYAARRIPEIADDIVNVDRAMRWGFNWDLGPFETWDAIGVADSVARMKREGFKVPDWVVSMLESGRQSFYDGTQTERRYFDVAGKGTATLSRDPHHVDLAALKEDKGRIVKDNLGATLIDLGDGVLGLEVHTKMNTIDGDVMEMMAAAVQEAEKNFEALVIGNDGLHFGAGANLMLIYMAAQQKEWGQVEQMVRVFQDGCQGLRYAKVPVVAAPFQYTFGGAAEVAMAADACQAHAETYMGLVEVGAGLVPAGGGCLRMVERFTQDLVAGVDLLPFVGEASLNIATAKVSTGAEEARKLRFLRDTDGISLNRDHLLHHAKMRALGLARAGYRPPRPRVLRAAGVDAGKTINIRVWGMVEGGFASEHDALIAKKVARILTGGDVPAGTERTEQDFLDLEREAFLSLCGEEKSQARMQSLLMSGKPLRN